MCICLKSNYLLHWGGREFINISGAMWCQYNINSTSWGTLLNWVVFLLKLVLVGLWRLYQEMWVFVGHKIFIQSCSSLGLKVCAVLPSKTIFLEGLKHDVQLLLESLLCRKLGTILFSGKIPNFAVHKGKLADIYDFKETSNFLNFQAFSTFSLMMKLCYLIVSCFYFIFWSAFHLYYSVD